MNNNCFILLVHVDWITLSHGLLLLFSHWVTRFLTAMWRDTLYSYSISVPLLENNIREVIYAAYIYIYINLIVEQATHILPLQPFKQILDAGIARTEEHTNGWILISIADGARRVIHCFGTGAALHQQHPSSAQGLLRRASWGGRWNRWFYPGTATSPTTKPTLVHHQHHNRRPTPKRGHAESISFFIGC